MAYQWLKMRSAIVPAVKAASMAQQWLLVGAFMMLNQFPQLMIITIAAFVVTTLFAFVTLPVEFDASNRALAWLDNSGITRGAEQEGAKDALKWAGMTYVASALPPDVDKMQPRGPRSSMSLMQPRCIRSGGHSGHLHSASYFSLHVFSHR